MACQWWQGVEEGECETGVLARDNRLAPRASSRTTALIVFVCAVLFVDTIFVTALTPILPHYVHRFAMSKTLAGLLVACYPIGTLVGSLPGGIVTTRAGVRPAVLLGLTLMSAATLTFGFAPSMAVLDLARFVQGLGGACTWAGSLSWLASAVPVERRGAAIGVAFSAAVGGALLGPVVGGIASAAGSGLAFAGATVAGVGLMISSLFLEVPAAVEPQPMSRSVRALRDISLSGGLWLTCLAGIAFGVVDVLAPLRLNKLGASAITISAAFLGAAAVEAAISPLVGRFADRLGRRRPALLSLAGSAVLALLLPTVSPAAILVALIVGGLWFAGTLFVPAAAMVSDGSERQGMPFGIGFGLTNLAWASGQSVAALGAGAIAQATSDLVPYVLLSIACGGTLFAATMLRRERRPPAHASPT